MASNPITSMTAYGTAFSMPAAVGAFASHAAKQRAVAVVLDDANTTKGSSAWRGPA
jgi:hypothetical protein